MNVSRKNPLHLSSLLIVAGTAFALLLIVILQVRVAGTESVPLGWRVREVQFADQGLGWFRNPAECAKCLERFPYMTTLDHWNSGSDSLKLVAEAPAENIRRMSLFPA